MASRPASNIDANRIIESLAATCRESPAAGGNLDFYLDLAEDLPAIVSNGDHLGQLFLGLIRKAMKAMPGGGSIRVSTRPWRSGPGMSHIEISIEDTGRRLPDGVFWNLYPPSPNDRGQTDEESDLAIIGQLVRDLGGLINCRSSDKGTRFLVLLPLRKQPVTGEVGTAHGC